MYNTIKHDFTKKNQQVFVKQTIHLLIAFSILFLSPTLQAQVLTSNKHQIVIANQEQKLAISLDCPSFILENQIVGGYSPLKKFGDVRKSEKEPFRVLYAPISLQGGGQLEIQLFIQWFSAEKLLRKWAKYRLLDTKNPVLLNEIVLDKIATQDSLISLPTVPGQSYPVFLDGFFAGIEFPVSSVRKESGQLIIAHQPGLKVQPDQWYESRKAVYCATQKGNEKEAFLSYIAANRPGNNEIHINYNSWWTSPVPYSEKEILELMKTFEEKMFIPYGVSFNTFCIDLGWSDPKSIWGIDTLLFPQRFANIQKAAKKMNTNLGLWISPSNMYSPKSLDSDWAEKHGYETFVIDSTKKAGRLCCLAGEHYLSEFRKQLVDMVSKYEIKQLKFDGFIFTPTPTLLCKELDHGHQPGYLSIEPNAEAFVETCRQIHHVSPDTWIETTCMGGDPSPWWLFYVNSVIGTFGGDYPEGRIPCPVYRESYTSARDYFNIQGATYGLAPIFAQEMLGVAHQTMDSFSNDAVTAIMRGNSFLPFYINPVYMDGTRWKMMAELITWTKNNTSIFQNTKVLLPESWQNGKVPRFKQDASEMPREAYGYAHCTNDRALIELRNPWIKNSEYRLKLDNSTGFSENIKNLSIISLYPEVRIYAQNLKYGDTVNIPLAPYETLVVTASNQEQLKELPNVADLLHGFGRVEIRKIEKTIINPVKIKDSSKIDPSNQGSETSPIVRFGLEGTVEVKAPEADLLVLIEGDNIPLKLDGTININGNQMPIITTENSRILPRWKASKKYWVFLKSPMKSGKNTISLQLDLPGSPLNVSVWAWAKKTGNTALTSYPNALPQPEDISMESVNLVEPFNTETIFHK